MEYDLQQSRDYFKREFEIESEQAPEKIDGIKEEIKTRSSAQKEQKGKIAELYEQMETVKLEYQKEKLLTEIRTDERQINALLEQKKKPPKSLGILRTQRRYDRILNTVNAENFNKIIETLPEIKAKALSDKRERAAAREKVIELDRSR